MIYLLHFHERIHPNHPSRHYAGFSESLHDRIFTHLQGQSKVRLIRVAYQRGIKFSVARCWKGDRRLERYFKSLKNAPKFCPYCSANPWDLYFPNSVKPVRELTGNALKEKLLFA